MASDDNSSHGIQHGEIKAVPDLPLCLCVLKHRSLLAREGGIFLPKIFFLRFT